MSYSKWLAILGSSLSKARARMGEGRSRAHADRMSTSSDRGEDRSRLGASGNGHSSRVLENADPTPPAPNGKTKHENKENTRKFKLVRKSGLFDKEYYQKLLRKLEIYEVDINPIEHYFRRGEALGIAPNPLFD
jgi:hypothetical protein